MRLRLPWQPRPTAGRSPPARIWIGTQPGDGGGSIHCVEFDPVTGSFGRPRAAADLAGPSCLCIAPGAATLHCVLEQGGERGGRVRSYGMADGTLRLLGEAASGGEYPCHLALDRDGRQLAVANYGGGVSVLSIGIDGAVTGAPRPVVPTSSGATSTTGRSRPHWVGFRDESLWIADFGMDCVRRVPLSAGVVEESSLPFPSRTGPRTIAWHSGLPLGYVVGETDNAIHVFDPDVDGAPSIIESHALLPSGASVTSAAAHVGLNEQARRLYASNRGHDSIAVFDVSDTGSLRALGHASSGGAHPRHFTIDQSGAWMIVANRASNAVVALPLEAGFPGGVVDRVEVRAPVWVTFVYSS